MRRVHHKRSSYWLARHAGRRARYAAEAREAAYANWLLQHPDALAQVLHEADRQIAIMLPGAMRYIAEVIADARLNLITNIDQTIENMRREAPCACLSNRESLTIATRADNFNDFLTPTH